MNPYLLGLQLQAQREGFKLDPPALEGEERAEYIRWNVLALEDELHEMLSEVGWKPWASSRDLNRDGYLKELVDAYHFLMNLILVVKGEDQTVDELACEFARMYTAKREVNLRRQAEGYDGVANKCQECGRAREDVDVPKNTSRIWHCICGFNNVEK
jgi:hypothetical protein